MKWFQHDCDMHSDIKIKALIQKHGAEGYAVWLLCLELLGKDGIRGKLTSVFSWKSIIINTIYPKRSEDASKTEERLDSILLTLSELRLIDNKALEIGDLYVPKLMKRADTWTKKLLRSNSEETSNIGKYTKLQINSIREYYCQVKGINIKDVPVSEHKNYTRLIMLLLDQAGGDNELVNKSIKWLSEKNWDNWSLTTTLKWWADFMKQKDQGKPAYMREVTDEDLKRYMGE